MIKKMDITRIADLLLACMNHIEKYAETFSSGNDMETLAQFREVGFEDSEIKQLGFGYLLETEEEDDED